MSKTYRSEAKEIIYKLRQAAKNDDHYDWKPWERLLDLIKGGFSEELFEVNEKATRWFREANPPRP